MSDADKLNAFRTLASNFDMKAKAWFESFQAAEAEGNEKKAARCFGRYIGLTQSARDIRDILNS